MDYCDVFIRLSFWRHPFTSIAETLMKCYISPDLMKNQTIFVQPKYRLETPQSKTFNELTKAEQNDTLFVRLDQSCLSLTRVAVVLHGAVEYGLVAGEFERRQPLVQLGFLRHYVDRWLSVLPTVCIDFTPSVWSCEQHGDVTLSLYTRYIVEWMVH